MKTNNSVEKAEQQFLTKIYNLRQEVERLTSDNHDLKMALLTTAEHGDFITAQLEEVNRQLKLEILERKRSEITLKGVLETISRQKEDLEILTQILTEHGDSIEGELYERCVQANHLATVDALTQLANRRAFDRYLTQQWQKMLRKQLPLSLLICDIDCFKQYNDTYGHLAGDDCLRKIGQIFTESIDSACSLMARYGGEEFAAVLPHTDLEQAIAVVEKIQKAIEQLNIPHARSRVSDRVTLSIGLTCTIPSNGSSPSTLLDEADRLLYQAKQSGRNQCIHQVMELENAL
ncbi:GGDEF domain-containing protein [Lusitaniella coriacea LEGE 07157]|uniref:GGDEF domain-containing protein n=1 Tax=Lusitaniella coriacea LEGE 07157 TaxID=945747 RepID=A0A8J7DU93_9CYAN|nr:diguanylate cyclase [Lusitaniella coriacea]MBE9115446.1 GGDEF domain-containing protein [Lusitaniella coriacea LEGE 07157]